MAKALVLCHFSCGRIETMPGAVAEAAAKLAAQRKPA